MSETGYKCPKCGNEEGFTADSVWVLFTNVHITPDGWDWENRASLAADMHEECRMKCDLCAHTASASEFEDEYWKEQR